MLRDLPIQAKLRLITLIVSAAALLGAFSFFIVVQWITARDGRAAQLLAMAEILADQSTASLEFDQKEQGFAVLYSLKAEPEIVGAALYDRQGRVFAPYGFEPAPSPGPDGASWQGGHLLIHQPVRSAGERVGTVLLRCDLHRVRERLWFNLGTAAVLMAAALAAAYFLSARLGRWVSGPVTRLADVVRAVSSTKDYSARVAEAGKDELGLLITGFNDMLSQIQARDVELARARSELEKRVVERTAALSQAQQIARLGSWDWDPATGNVAWSDELYRVHGMLPADFGGGFEDFVKGVHPDDRAAFRAKLEEAVKRREGFTSDHRVIRPDGEVRVLQGSGKVLLDDAGRPTRVLGVMQDITERRKAEEAIQELNRKLREGMDELAAANKELEGFSYSVSHDLRAPLRAIDGFSRMLAEDCAGKLDEKGLRYIGVIRSNTQKMGQLIDDLLAFSRMGRKPVQPAPIDMTALVKSAYAELTTINPNRKIDFRLGALPPAQGDIAMIRQVFANLISNAIKYSRDRDPAVIEVEGRVDNGESVYLVRDNGVGFEMQYATKLFGVFQRLHSARDFEGTGVGLALVQRIVQRHGGRIWGEGKPDQGATFTFTLPRKESA